MNDIIILCPICKSELKPSSIKRVETLSEHVTNPNGIPSEKQLYNCPNDKCKSHLYGIEWLDCGEMISKTFFHDKDMGFVNDNYAPFNTITRRLNVEIYKTNVRDKQMLHPILCLFLLRPYIQHYYKADDDGNVLKHWTRVNFLRREGRRWRTNTNIKFKDTYYIHYISMLHTFKFLIKQSNRHLKNNDLEQLFGRAYNRSFIYRFTEFIVKILHHKKYNKYKKNSK